MAIFSVLLLILNYLRFRGLEDTVQNISLPAQILCKNLLHTPSEHLSFYQAVACGFPLKNSAYDILKVVSLWHLIIVSAGHFNLLLWILKRLGLQKTLFTPLFLLLFTLMTGAQPPVVRAYGEYCLNIFSTNQKLWIPSEYRTLYCSTILLLIFPSWSSSWSFLLSWLCGILIQILKNQTLFVQSLGMAIGVFPVICIFSVPHPLSFLFNWILGPPLSMVLFPISLLMIPFPFLHQLLDPLLNSILWICETLAGNFSKESLLLNPLNSYLLFSWFYLLFLQILLIWRKKHGPQ